MTPSELSVRVLDGAGYQRVGNTITPEPGVIGALDVRVVASDGELDSAIFDLSVQVIADSVPPEIVLIGSATVTIRLGDFLHGCRCHGHRQCRRRHQRPRSSSTIPSTPTSARYLHRHLQLSKTSRATPPSQTRTVIVQAADRRCPRSSRGQLAAADAGRPVRSTSASTTWSSTTPVATQQTLSCDRP